MGQDALGPPQMVDEPGHVMVHWVEPVAIATSTVAELPHQHSAELRCGEGRQFGRAREREREKEEEKDALLEPGQVQPPLLAERDAAGRRQAGRVHVRAREEPAAGRLGQAALRVGPGRAWDDGRCGCGGRSGGSRFEDEEGLRGVEGQVSEEPSSALAGKGHE